MHSGPRAMLVLSALVGALAPARSASAGDSTISQESPPLTQLEARVGYGLAFGGGAGDSVTRTSPVTMTVLADHAVIEEPWTSIYGGIVVEGAGRGAAGLMLGARVRPGRGWIRLAGGAIALLVPATLYGPVASVGGCLPVARSLAICVDLESAVFVGGTDLPAERVAAQTQLVVGAAFDAW